MKGKVARALDGLGVKDPIKLGLNRLLRIGGMPPIGVPRLFADLERLAGTSRPRPAESRGRILFVTFRGWTTHVALEAVLGEAAAQRGFRPEYFTCGGPLPLCGINTFRAADPTPCADCHGYVSRALAAVGFDRTRLDDWVPPAERAEIAAAIARVPDDELSSFHHRGAPLGEWTRISVRWFLLRGGDEPSPRQAATDRAFLAAAVAVYEAFDRMLAKNRPDRIVLLSGLFFAERIAFEHARARGIPVTTYERGFLPSTWVFRHDAVACRYEIADDFRAEGDRPLAAAALARVESYLSARSGGGSDADRYWPERESDRETIAARLGLDPDRPLVTAFSNITWDSAVQGRDVAFAGMFEWLEHSVDLARRRPEMQLVIRVHPAEVRLDHGRATAEAVIDTLTERVGRLPENVRFVPPESGLSSYTLARMSRASIVYTSTLGLELACVGRPVIVAGETHYRGLGFTQDAKDPISYDALVEQALAGGLPPVDEDRARRYASFFFFRYMVPVAAVRENEGHEVRVELTSFDELSPGRDAALDAVLEGLCAGRAVFHPPLSAD